MQNQEQLDDVLKGKFIKRVFEDSIKDIDKAQVAYMGAHNFVNENWYSGRSFIASDTALDYTQMLRHRFVDMKTRNSKKGKLRKKAHPIHNKIIYGHYNNIIKELAYGFTEAAKEGIRQLEK
jgi:hypothetical protein